MKKFLFIILSLLSSFSYGQGCVDLTQQPEPFCDENVFVIKNESDLATYLQNFGDAGFGPKDVVIDKSFNSFNLDVYGPCKVTINSKVKMRANLNICFNAKEVEFKDGSQVVGNNIEIITSNDVQINESVRIDSENLLLKAQGNIFLKEKSFLNVNKFLEISSDSLGAGSGVTLEPKVKMFATDIDITLKSAFSLGDSSFLKASNLLKIRSDVNQTTSTIILGNKAKLEGRIVSVSASSFINLLPKVSVEATEEILISTQDGLSNSFVNLSREGSLTAPIISFNGVNRASLADNTVILASTSFTMDSLNCEISPTAIITSPTLIGRCVGPVNPNRSPVANAGSDHVLTPDEFIYLDGSKSFDLDGDRLVYSWSILNSPAGSTPILENSQSPFPRFKGDLPGTYEISLTVSDGREVSTPSIIRVSSINVRPDILFLNDEIVNIGETVSLSGLNVIDLDDDSLTYEWTLISAPAGSTTTIIDSSQQVAQIFIDIAGDYIVELRVFDGAEYSVPKRLTLSTSSIRPTAIISGNSILNKNELTTLNGNSSLNPNGGILTYTWSILYQEPGSSINFLGGTSQITTFSSNTSGKYIVQLIVSDGIYSSFPKQYIVSVNNQLPLIQTNFEENRVVVTGESLFFDASTSLDPDGDSIIFNWEITSKPVGSNSQISSVASSNPSIIFDVSGEYRIKLTLSDSENSVEREFVVFSNFPPVADFSTSLNNFSGTSFSLDGTISTDADGDPLSYTWEIISKPADSTANLIIDSLGQQEIFADKAGDYQVRLTVSDGIFSSVPITKTISVLPFVNNPPSIVPLLDQTIEVGQTLEFTVESVDPDGNTVNYLLDPSSDKLPGMKFDGTTGKFSWSPGIEQTGTYNLVFIASDGDEQVQQDINITVTGPLFPGNTSITGTVLVSNSKVDFDYDKPIIGATVTVLNTNVSTTTNEFGQFTLENIPNIEEVVFKIDSSTATNSPENGRFANFIEILHPIVGVDNIVKRPFYLPVINMDSVSQVIPGQETIVYNPEIDIEVRIPADSAVNADGTPYLGDFSVSLVPANLAPVSLPDGLELGQLITVQPSGIRFTKPAQITYPTLDTLQPGVVVDVIQMNDRSGRFEKVADGVVSADGKRITSTNGGLINTSWGGIIPRILNSPIYNIPTYKCSRGRKGGLKKCKGSFVNAATGEMIQDISLNTHKSLGQERGLTLIYSSLVATNTQVDSVLESDDSLGNVGRPLNYSVRPVIDDTPLNSIITFPTSSIRPQYTGEFLLPMIYNTQGYDTGVYKFDFQRISDWGATVSTRANSEDNNQRNKFLENPEQTGFARAWTVANLMRVYEASNGEAVIVRDGFDVSYYEFNEEANSYKTPVTFDDTLSKIDGSFVLTEKNGTIHNFDNNGRLVSSTDRNKRQTLYAYNNDNTLNYIQDPAGLRTSFGYDSLGLISITTPGGRVFTINKDTNGNIIEIVNPDSTSKKFRYLPNGLQYQKEFENGATNTYEYNKNNQIIKISKSGGEIEELENFEEINVIEEFDAKNLNNLKSAFGNKNLNIAVSSFQEVRVQKCDTRYYLESQGSVVAAPGFREKLKISKNKAHRSYPLPSRGTWSRSEPVIKERKICRLVEEERWVTESVSPNNLKEINAYDSNGNLALKVDPTNRATRNFYDTKNNLVRTSNYLDLRADQTFEYDENYSEILKVKDYLGRITNFEHDDSGNITSVTDPLGQETKLSYNSKGQVTSIVDFKGQETRIRYDLKTGNIKEVIDPLGNVTKSQYDLSGNLTQITDPKGQVTQFEYDLMNRVTKTIASDFSETSFTYDNNGNLTTVNDPRSGVTTFVYDERNRVIERIDPKAQKEEFFYDEVGQLISKVDRNGLVTAYEYDDDQRLLKRVLDSGKTYSYTYDDAGRVLSISDSVNVISYTYDEVGRVKTTSFSGVNQPNFTLENEYDFNGNRTALKTSEGNFLYSYDELNRLKTVENPQNLVFETVYDSIGRRAEMILPNNTLVGYNYDRSNRIKEINHMNGATELATFAYDYDKNGNITSIATARNGLANLNQSLAYTYDAINQLITATNPIQGQIDEAFNYDGLGNRLTNQSQTVSAIYDESNRLIENQTHNFTYDLEGNMTSKVDKSSGALVQYTWDEENQLVKIEERTSITAPPSKTVEYVYDVLGRRIEKRVNGIITRYVYDNEDILFELDGNNQITKVFTHGAGIDEPLAFEDRLANQTYFYHADHLGSIVGLSNSTGNLVQHYVYDSFGNVDIFDSTGTSFTLGTEPIKQPYGYTARELDEESDLYYYRARYYNSGLGRFISEDPIGFGGNDFNHIRYSKNNPIIFSDPLGLLTFVYGGGLTFVNGGGVEGSGGGYYNFESGGSGAFVSVGVGVGQNVGGDAFFGLYKGSVEDLTGYTNNINISIGIFSFTLVFNDDFEFQGGTLGPGFGGVFSITRAITGTSQNPVDFDINEFLWYLTNSGNTEQAHNNVNGLVNFIEYLSKFKTKSNSCR